MVGSATVAMNILVLTPDYPSYTFSAGTKRLAHMLDALSSDHNVTCGLLSAVTGHDIDGICESHFNVIHIPSVAGFVKHCFNHFYDVIVFEYWRTGRQYAWVSRIISPRSLLVVDCVDLEYIRLSRSSKYSPEHVAQTHREETRLIRYSDAVICVSRNEAEIVKRELSKPDDLVITFSVVYDIVAMERHPEPGLLLFVGNGGHMPNVDAMTWFCNEVMPYVNPLVRLRLVGANWPESLTSNNVDVIGFVDDIRAEYAKCSYVVSPIRFGSGVNGKVAEAYCYGLPMIMSPLAADGCGIAQGEGLTILSTEISSDWVQTIDRLVSSEPCVAVAVSDNIADQFSYTTNANRLLEFTNRLEGSRVFKTRRWQSTVLYALEFVVSHIRHRIRQK